MINPDNKLVFDTGEAILFRFDPSSFNIEPELQPSLQVIHFTGKV